MKIKFSRITTGFAIAGLSVGMLTVLESIAYSMASDTGKKFISNHTDLPLYLDPSSIMLMALENKPSTSDVFAVFVSIVVVDLILYGLAGLVISQLYRLIKRLAQPSSVRD